MPPKLTLAAVRKSSQIGKDAASEEVSRIPTALPLHRPPSSSESGRTSTSQPPQTDPSASGRESAARADSSRVALVSANARPDADLVVGASSSTLRGFLPAALGQLRLRHSTIHAHVVTGSDRQLLARLANHQIDLLIARQPVGRERYTLNFDYLCAEAVPVVVRPHHPLAGMSHLMASELSAYPIIVPQFDPVLAAGIERHLITEGSICDHDPVVADSLEFAVALAQQSDCLLAIPQGAIDADLQRRSLISLPIDRPLPDVDVGIVTLANHPASDAQHILAGLMREVLSPHPA